MTRLHYWNETDRFIISMYKTPEQVPDTHNIHTNTHLSYSHMFPRPSFPGKGLVSDLLQPGCTVTPSAPSHHHHLPSLCPTPHPNAEASLLLSTQSCSTPWPCAVPHYRAVRKLLGAPVTLKDWWRKMGWRRGEEQVVKKRMSCLMGCQECNSIIMKSDSGELAGWMDG